MAQASHTVEGVPSRSARPASQRRQFVEPCGAKVPFLQGSQGVLASRSSSWRPRAHSAQATAPLGAKRPALQTSQGVEARPSVSALPATQPRHADARAAAYSPLEHCTHALAPPPRAKKPGLQAWQCSPPPARPAVQFSHRTL